MAVAVGAVRYCLVLDPKVHDLGEEALLGAHRELLVVPKAILVLEIQLMGSLRVSRPEASCT
jgi:hypothetical protein